MVCQWSEWWCYHYNWESYDPGEPSQDTWRRDSIHFRPSDSKFASLSGSLGGVGGVEGPSSLDPTVFLGVKQSLLALLSILYTRANKLKCLVLAQRIWNSHYSLTNATFSWDSSWDCWGTPDDFLICGRAAFLWFFSPWGFNNLNPLVEMVWSLSPALLAPWKHVSVIYLQCL